MAFRVYKHDFQNDFTLVFSFSYLQKRKYARFDLTYVFTEYTWKPKISNSSKRDRKTSHNLKKKRTKNKPTSTKFDP